MKRLISAIMLVLLLAGSAFALEAREYRLMKEHHKKLAEAEHQLTEAYNRLKQVVPDTRRRELRESQQEWLNVGRDVAADKYMQEGYSAAKAYTMATNDRVKELTRLYRIYSAKNRK